MSLPFGKIKNLLGASDGGRSSRKVFEKLEPVVGFKMNLVPGNVPTTQESGSQNVASTIPELCVHLIGARHLPATFGLKSVEGYMVMVKLFPGTLRYNSPIETSSWPQFNEIFKFPMGSSTKSSIKRPKNPTNEQTLPQKLFKGHFVVLTVFALLELPPNATFGAGMRQAYRSIRRKGSLLLKDINKSAVPQPEEEISSGEILKLTKSESRRNIGSVTYFLDPKIFNENTKTGIYYSDEFWLPLKDITVTPTSSTITNSINSSTKGQVEVILELHDPIELADDTVSQTSESRSTSSKPWSFSEVKRKMRNVTRKEKVTHTGMSFMITIAKMRCAIKVKEEFENIAGTIYVKMSIFERDILSSTWRSDPFLPSLSTRWNPNDSTIRIPLNNVSDLDHISIKISVATKSKMGKKIVLGTLIMGSQGSCAKLEHWQSMIESRGSPVAMWHNFE
ncbi:uncharacterized protein LOC129792638 [Lutzomyia longipalpis]|uniref:uncharacterized protein LOC129792638 n=1 Tax=Lutzomyia longipalpis TaxID=7200 RepID=UPI0024838D7B|nr:uncharacterized protein LOC129792638 [Lutzomyia longipalpis]